MPATSAAPTTAIRGTIDTGRWAAGYPHTAETAELTYEVADPGQRLAWTEGLGNITLAARLARLALAA